MSTISDLRMYGRFIFGLPGFLRRRMTLDEAREAIRRGLAEREENFLRVVRRGIFENPGSPYLPLLKHAQCELSDIEASVRSKGLDPTLIALREAGVYVSFEEYKGRMPLIRGGEVIPVGPQSFANPLTAKAYTVETGGTSSGAASRINTDLDNIWSTVPHLMLLRHIHGAMDLPWAIWRGPLPDPTGVGIILRGTPYRGHPETWFSPVVGKEFTPTLKNRIATAYIIWMTRLICGRCPSPEPVPLDEAVVLARWAAEMARTHGGSHLAMAASLAVRVCVAAYEEGIDLTGVVILVGGEPMTAARQASITRTGACMAPEYISSDMGPIGHGCAHPAEPGDQHLLEDCVALIQHPREIMDTGVEVDAFYFTSLRPAAATILLNVESDDYGVIEQRSCGCEFDDLGYHRHITGIRSFSKLTGEGVTLVGSEMTRILEEVLPEKFGGGPLDYQLVEEEDENGLSRLVLLVHPRVDIPGEERVVEGLLEALGTDSDAAGLARVFWKQADTFRVRREEPEWTSRGKLRALRIATKPTSERASSTDIAPSATEATADLHKESRS
jgi:hypothetical protein